MRDIKPLHLKGKDLKIWVEQIAKAKAMDEAANEQRILDFVEEKKWSDWRETRQRRAEQED